MALRATAVRDATAAAELAASAFPGVGGDDARAARAAAAAEASLARSESQAENRRGRVCACCVRCSRYADYMQQVLERPSLFARSRMHLLASRSSHRTLPLQSMAHRSFPFPRLPPSSVLPPFVQVWQSTVTRHGGVVDSACTHDAEEGLAWGAASARGAHALSDVWWLPELIVSRLTAVDTRSTRRLASDCSRLLVAGLTSLPLLRSIRGWCDLAGFLEAFAASGGIEAAGAIATAEPGSQRRDATVSPPEATLAGLAALCDEQTDAEKVRAPPCRPRCYSSLLRYLTPCHCSSPH